MSHHIHDPIKAGITVQSNTVDTDGMQEVYGGFILHKKMTYRIEHRSPKAGCHAEKALTIPKDTGNNIERNALLLTRKKEVGPILILDHQPQLRLNNR